MIELVSRADRTRAELAANRRRFRREGVGVMLGDQWLFLQIESARPIPVRPAFRGERLPDGPRELAAAFLDGFFRNRIWPWTAAGIALLLAIAAFNHFHP